MNQLQQLKGKANIVNKVKSGCFFISNHPTNCLMKNSDSGILKTDQFKIYHRVFRDWESEKLKIASNPRAWFMKN